MSEDLLGTLKDIDQWVCWTYEQRDGEQTKPPIVPRDDARYASTSDSETWDSYEQAIAYHDRADTDTEGVGFVLTENGVHAGADLDGCRDPETGEIEPWAEDVVDELDSYTEVSPSGTGLRVFLLGFMPDGRTRREQRNDLEATAELDKTTELEMYDDGRYLTFTGDHVEGTPRDAQQRNSAFHTVHEEYLAEDDESAADASSRGDESHDAPDLDLDDETVLQRARDAGNGDKFERLENGYDGFNGGDTSKADKAFCQMLAFWTGGDRRQMDRLFRNSRRMRDKWDEVHSGDGDTYGEMTIRAALDDQTEFYDPSGSSNQPDPAEIDWDEVQRGEEILKSQTSRTEPYADLEYRNGCYGYEWVRTDEDGNVVASGFDTVANFSLELDRRLDTYEGEILKIIVHPDHPMEDEYEVQVHPTVFNEVRDFREEIVRGRTTNFNPNNRSSYGSREVLNHLRQTVGRQAVSQQRGTEFIGMHGDDLDEWVTPDGTLTPEGWHDDVEYAYYEKSSDNNADLESSSLGNKVEIGPESGADYDEDELAELLEVLPWTRKPSRGLPVLGWFYAAPLKPIIQDEEGQFNLLQVAGGTGTGKTSTLEMFYELFGAAPSPFSCDDTRFTIEKRLSSSCGLPIWLDEFKPTDMDQNHLQWLYQKFREVFRGASTSKGRPSLGEVLFHFRAPVVFSGEQTVSKPAVRRRTVITQFSSASTQDQYERAYCKVVGASYETDEGRIESFEGFDLEKHALAYYQYILSQSDDVIRNIWRSAQKTRQELVQHMGVGSMDRSEQQGLQTIIFGFKMFERFAEAMGADADALPGEDELREAVEHVAMNIGPDGRRRQHIDDFTELLARAAAADYLEEGEHYKLVSVRKYDAETALAWHMPSSFDAVKRYMRDYNVESEYSMLGRGDYVDNFADRADESGSYPLATSHKVKGLGQGSKTVLIDATRAEESLGTAFSLRSFTDGAEEEEVSESSIEDEATPLDALHVKANEGEYVSVTVEAEMDAKNSGLSSGDDNRPVLRATARDETGECDIVSWDEHTEADQPKQPLTPWPEIEDEDQTAVFISDARVSEYDGTLQLVLERGKTDAQTIQPGVAYTSPLQPENEDQDQLDAAADGGQQTAPPDDRQGLRAEAEQLVEVLRGHANDEFSKPEVLAQASNVEGVDGADRAEAVVEKAVSELGALARTDDEGGVEVL
jgi:hypothetical protein